MLPAKRLFLAVAGLLNEIEPPVSFRDSPSSFSPFIFFRFVVLYFCFAFYSLFFCFVIFCICVFVLSFCTCILYCSGIVIYFIASFAVFSASVGDGEDGQTAVFPGTAPLHPLRASHEGGQETLQEPKGGRWGSFLLSYAL